MKTIFCFSAFFLLIFTDVCSSAATKTGFLHLKEAKTGYPHLHATKIGTPHLLSTKTGFPNLLAAKNDECSKCPKHDKPMDCAELLENGVNETGVHTIYPRSRETSCKSIDVYCDMETDGGGWTVIQRRGQHGNGEDYFVKKWKAYKEGFGNMKKEFWLGNDQIHAITNQDHYSVRMDLTDESGKTAFEHYENFWIENEDGKYKLHLTDGSGPAGDAISNHDGYAFYTVDKPNHADDDKTTRSGGWWRNSKKTSSLNGLNLHKNAKAADEDGINWGTFGGFKISLKDTEIKIRPKRFQGSPEKITE